MESVARVSPQLHVRWGLISTSPGERFPWAIRHSLGKYEGVAEITMGRKKHKEEWKKEKNQENEEGIHETPHRSPRVGRSDHNASPC
jgi:hypothetical protein